MICGCGTDAGKTIVAAIVATLLKGDYWKPVQCDIEENTDTFRMKTLLNPEGHEIFDPAYSFQAPCSPHHAARLENRHIDIKRIIPPVSERPLIIEGVGGIYVPLTDQVLTMNLFKLWNCRWIVVSRHYIGSINHTLLTVEALKKHRVPIAGIIFNGESNPDSERAILKISQLPCIGRLLPEKNIDSLTIQRYAEQWKPNFSQLLQ